MNCPDPERPFGGSFGVDVDGILVVSWLIDWMSPHRHITFIIDWVDVFRLSLDRR